MKSKRTKRWGGALLKVAGSACLLLFLYSKSENLFKEFIQNALDIGYVKFLLALAFFQLSVLISTHRLQILLTDVGLNLTFKKNLSLYYLGMFLNLFVPGGIGGDVFKGYKIAQLTGSTKRKVFAILLSDRLIGLAALVVLMSLFYKGISINHLSSEFKMALTLLSVVGIFFTPFIIFIAVSYFSATTINSYIKALLLALGVQFFQVLTIWILLTSLAPMETWMAYFTLFLLSSLVTIIPVTIGGIGLRELSFSWPPLENLFYIDNSIGISLSLTFFIITAISSIFGIIPFINGIRTH